MNYGLILRTVMHLRPTQVWHQVANRLARKRIKTVEAPPKIAECALAEFPTKPTSRMGEDVYSFLNIEHSPADWNDASLGMLWAYNLNYMDYLLQPGMEVDSAMSLIKRFIDELPSNKVGLDPYPIALRGINWVKWLAVNGKDLDAGRKKRINDSLYTQYHHLARTLEYHLLGNHLLEDAFSLTIGSIYFSDNKLWSKAESLLRRQLDEQILPDGAHYEQSPMYHCILLDRLLDVYNVSSRNLRFGASQQSLDTLLEAKARLMLGHLDSIAYQGVEGNDLPLFNDSAQGIAPTPNEIREYARRLGLSWQVVPMRECGYRKLAAGNIEALVDVGGITATYQPGHTHADALNYELRIAGMPFVVDTGISTYDKTPRRQLERGTAAHNTVTVYGRDSSEVWGGFRVGRRASVKIDSESQTKVAAVCTGPGYSHHRTFSVSDGVLSILDKVSSSAVSRIHLAPGVSVLSTGNEYVETDMATIKIYGADSVNVEPVKISREYNRFCDTCCVSIAFGSEMRYEIIPKQAIPDNTI